MKLDKQTTTFLIQNSHVSIAVLSKLSGVSRQRVATALRKAFGSRYKPTDYAGKGSPDNPLGNFAEVAKSAISRIGIEQAAKICGLSEITIKRFYRWNSNPSARTIAKLDKLKTISDT